MTALADLATAKMEVLRIEATPCAWCAHPLKSHSIAHALLAPNPPKGLGSCRGEFMGEPCKCKGWLEV